MTFPRVRSSALIATMLFLTAQVPAEQPALRYAGTVGQQHIVMILEVSGDAVIAGRYTYDSQKSTISIVDSRQFGTTVILQDEDGNILHLHFEDAAGEKTGGFKTAEILEGTLDRGELDLPVKLTRTASEK